MVPVLRSRESHEKLPFVPDVVIRGVLLFDGFVL